MPFLPEPQLAASPDLSLLAPWGITWLETKKCRRGNAVLNWTLVFPWKQTPMLLRLILRGSW